MSDKVRRVKHPWKYYRTDCGTRDHRHPGHEEKDRVLDDPNGDRAIVPWEVWERVIAALEQADAWMYGSNAGRAPAEIEEVEGDA